jgi:hypothetical protein
VPRMHEGYHALCFHKAMQYRSPPSISVKRGGTPLTEGCLDQWQTHGPRAQP